jgi:hypothetical protein
LPSSSQSIAQTGTMFYSTAVTTLDRPRASREERWRITSDRFNTDSCHNGVAYLLYTPFHVYECAYCTLSRRIVQARCRSHVPSGCVSGFVVGLLQGWRRKRRAVAWCWGNCRLIASARRRVPAHGVECTVTGVAVRFSCRLAVENVERGGPRRVRWHSSSLRGRVQDMCTNRQAEKEPALLRNITVLYFLQVKSLSRKTLHGRDAATVQLAPKESESV